MYAIHSIESNGTKTYNRKCTVDIILPNVAHVYPIYKDGEAEDWIFSIYFKYPIQENSLYIRIHTPICEYEAPRRQKLYDEAEFQQLPSFTRATQKRSALMQAISLYYESNKSRGL